jgi:hypothetical protein
MSDTTVYLYEMLKVLKDMRAQLAAMQSELTKLRLSSGGQPPGTGPR